MSGDAQRILITGATGYVGGRLARHLAASNRYEVVLGSRRPQSSNVDPALRLVMTNYSDAASLRSACEGVDAIVHLAGANAQSCAADPALAFEVNAVGTARLVAAAVLSGVERFVYLSTAHVYGGGAGLIGEETCARGTHPYATSHRAGEDIVLHARARRELDGVAARLSNSFGAPASASADCWMLLVPDLCRQAVRSRRLVLRSSGLQRRDFITLTDTCAALEHLLAVESTGDGLFNVGGRWAPTVREMADRIAALCPRVLGYEVPVETAPPAAGERSEEFDFRIDRLLATGFRLARDIDGELAATLEFCAKDGGPYP